MNNFRKVNLLIIFILFSIKITTAQIVYDKKIEFELKYESNTMIYSFKQKGILIYSEKSNPYSPIIIEKYNSELEKVKEIEIEPPTGYKLYQKYANETDLYLLFIVGYGKFICYKINVLTLDFKSYAGNFSSPSKIISLASTGNYLYIKIEKAHNTDLLKIDLTTAEITKIDIHIDGIKDKKLHITKMLIAEGPNDLIVFLDIDKFTDKTFYVLPIKETGKIGSIIKIEFPEDTYIIPLTASSVGTDEYIFTGYYSSDYTNPQGIFFCKTYVTQTLFYKQYKFTDFKEFYSKYKPPIVKGSNKQGVSYIRYNIKLAQNPIIYSGDQFVFYCDFFEQVLELSNNMKPGEPVAYLAGYSYENSLVAGIDANGNLLWNNSFPLSGFLTQELISSISVFNPSNPLQLLIPGHGEHNKITIDPKTGTTQIDKIYGLGSYLYHQDNIYYFSGWSENLTKKKGTYFIAKGHFE